MDKNTNLISVMVTAEAIKQGGFLLGRYHPETAKLNEVRVINGRASVPGSTEHANYKLIGVAEDGALGQPLDDFVEEFCTGWDGVNAITLYFNPETGIGSLDHWTPVEASLGKTA